MIGASIYVKDSITLEYLKLDLFSDEKISVNSSIQNISDISKTFSDYSQSFTVPASKNNNKIFKHWYNNDIDFGYDQRRRSDAYIELDSILFRNGKIQLESVDFANGKVLNYKLTFLGILVSLKDTFNNLLLKDLTLDNTYDLVYTPDVVKNLVTTTAVSTNVMFPLISSENVWTYGAGTTYDISNSTKPIRYNDLFPAIKLDAVLRMIETQFGITFNRTSANTFLNDTRFLNAYLWLKNAEKFLLKESTSLITWDSLTGSSAGFIVDLANESFSGNGVTYPGFLSATLNINVSGSGDVYNVHLYKNNVEYSKQTFTSTNSNRSISIVGASGIIPTTDVYTVKISAINPVTFDAQIELRINFGMASAYSYMEKAPQTSAANKLPIKDYFPEIKIEDFFSGLLKQFNLTCYSIVQNVYEIETIESFYASGNIIDISKYIIIDSQNLDRIKSFNKIKFEYEKSENVISANFLSANSRSYGDLLQDFESDGSEYNIKLPFELLAFNKLSGNLVVGYALKFDLKQYVPKPVILYDLNPSGLTSAPSYYFTGSTNNAYTNYKAFVNETLISGVYHSLVWGSENSFFTSTIPNSLYFNYYQNYLQNVFNIKTRTFKTKAILPLSIITTLRLKDRIQIRDKKYIINNMVTDLTTNEVQFELITDFRIL